METPVINDLSISVATENGTGSTSANIVLFKAIFKMGIPCSSKNMFPSYIQGLPTWYQVRACADGYMSRNDVIFVMVMFNNATAAKDIHRVREGGVILYDDSTPLGWTAHGSRNTGGAGKRGAEYARVAKMLLEAGASIADPADPDRDPHGRWLLCDASKPVAEVLRRHGART